MHDSTCTAMYIILLVYFCIYAYISIHLSSDNGNSQILMNSYTISGTYKEYYKLLSKRLEYLQKLLLDLRMKKTVHT